MLCGWDGMGVTVGRGSKGGGLYVYGWFNWFPSSIMCRENGVMGVLVGKEVS